MKKQLFLVLVAAFLVFGSQKAFAQETEKVIFPISELGDCASKGECKTYCDDAAHVDACLTFAEKRKLMSSEEITKARIFAKLMRNKDIILPGNAKNPAQAKRYCADSTHQEECLKFAEENGLVKSEDASHARKFISLLKSGLTPGGCKDKDACESFCKQEANHERCLKFAEENGIISNQEAQQAREFKEQGGPGGCKSKEECETYCNDSTNQDECIQFAEKRGLINREDSEKIKEGMNRLRSNVGEHPEFRACILRNTDEQSLEKIKKGEFVPNAELGDSIKDCTVQFQEQIQQKAEERVNSAPAEVRVCLQTEIGDRSLDELKQGEALDTTKADKVRACFEKPPGRTPDPTQTRPEVPESIRKCVLEKTGRTDVQGMTKEELAPIISKCNQELKDAQLRNSLREQEKRLETRPPVTNKVPTDGDACLTRLYGSDYQAKIKSGALSEDQVKKALQECAGKLEPRKTESSGTPPPVMVKPPVKVPEPFNSEQ